jgi:hypothetical protein
MKGLEAFRTQPQVVYGLYLLLRGASRRGYNHGVQ